MHQMTDHPRHTLTTAAMSAALLGLCGAAGAATQTIDLAPVANTRIEDAVLGGATYPTGALTLGGVPFAVGAQGNNIWNSHVAAGGGDGIVSVDVSVNLASVSTVHTLISSIWGEHVDGTWATIEFLGSGDGYYRVALDGNAQIRDYNYNPNYTTNLDGAWTREVWSNGQGVGTQHLDMQTFALPATFADETLQTIRLTDAGGLYFQRTFLAGVTVEVSPVPEPTPALMLGLGLVAVAGRRAAAKRRG